MRYICKINFFIRVKVTQIISIIQNLLTRKVFSTSISNNFAANENIYALYKWSMLYRMWWVASWAFYVFQDLATRLSKSNSGYIKRRFVNGLLKVWTLNRPFMLENALLWIKLNYFAKKSGTKCLHSSIKHHDKQADGHNVLPVGVSYL